MILKFRVFVDEKIREVYAIKWNEDGCFVMVEYRGGLVKTFPADVVKPMQFTGLFDKNGKEIYEGDILGRNHLGEMQVEGVIAYDKDLSRIVFNQVNGAFEEINKVELNLLEVIGNVYENQELIDR